MRFARPAGRYAAVVGDVSAYVALYCVRATQFSALVCESVTKSYKLLQKVTIFDKKVTKSYRENNKMLQKTQKK